MRLILVRHGLSAWNAERRVQGQADPPLAAEGRAQAAALGPAVAALAPGPAVASDLDRARTTAALLGRPDAVPEPLWREIDVGDWSGRTTPELRRADPDAYRAWRAGRLAPPNGEGWDAFRDRLRRALAALPAADGKATLVVTHGGVVRTLCAMLLGLPPGTLGHVAPASLSVIDTLGPTAPGPAARLVVYNLTPRPPDLDPPV